MVSSTERPRPPPNRRRDKPQLSCDPCRHRKLKCDRQHPCGACSKRGLVNSCSYVATITTTTASTASEALRPAAVQRQPSNNFHDRISELESLVVTLMKGQSAAHTTATTLGPRLPPKLPSLVPNEIRKKYEDEDGTTVSVADPGTLKLKESGTTYVQSVHWEAILTKIRGLKEDAVTDGKAASAQGSHLFYGPNRHASRDEILVAVPPRPIVDRLMALHFDSYIITPYLLHNKKFLREYEAFWENPAATSVAWIGLLFSMLYIGTQLQTFTIDPTDSRAESLRAEYFAMKDAFKERAVQCLILAKYTTGGPYILETLLTILTGEFVLLTDSTTDGWLFISTVLHLAMRMGYHRDPDHFPGISPFEAEMRRRIWTMILQLDLVLSLEMGLPRNATGTHIDTKEPRNLFDSDFDEDTIKMPSPRPETEWTPVLPLIARGRLISAVGLICDINTNTDPPSFEELIKVDSLLEDIHKRAIPPVLRWEAMRHPITDSPAVLVQRISIETTYYKSRILLYRRALVGFPGRSLEERDRQSMRICVDFALKILSFQQMLHEESQPFGRLGQLRWKVTRIFNQDVLLATSVLCLYLQDIDKFEPNPLAPETGQTWDFEEIRQRLTASHKIWRQMGTASPEARKVAKALSIVLGETDSFAEDDSEIASYDFSTDFDVSLDEFGTAYNSQFPSGFYSPLTFFNNVLENQAI